MSTGQYYLIELSREEACAAQWQQIMQWALARANSVEFAVDFQTDELRDLLLPLRAALVEEFSSSRYYQVEQGPVYFARYQLTPEGKYYGQPEVRLKRFARYRL